MATIQTHHQSLFMDLPREMRNKVHKCLVYIPGGVPFTLSGRPNVHSFTVVITGRRGARKKEIEIKFALPYPYIGVSKQIKDEVMSIWHLNDFRFEERNINAVLPKALALPINQHLHNVTVELNAFPGDVFVGVVPGLKQPIAMGKLRILKLRILGTTNLDARIAKNKVGQELVEFVRKGIISRLECDPESGQPKFWATDIGHSMLSVLGSSDLSKSIVEVASHAHWALWCRYHQPLDQPCQPVTDHWANLMEAPTASTPFLEINGLDLIRSTGYTEKKRDEKEVGKVEEGDKGKTAPKEKEGIMAEDATATQENTTLEDTTLEDTAWEDTDWEDTSYEFSDEYSETAGEI